MYARVSALLIALAFGLTAAAGAQETTGSISGRVVDTQGLGVPGVNVTVTGPQGARSFVTDSEGNFRGPYLTPGTYTVRAELQGFKTVEQKNVNVSLGQTVDLNMRMEVGGLMMSNLLAPNSARIRWASFSQDSSTSPMPR